MKIKTRLCLSFGIMLIFFLLATMLYGVYKFQENSFKDSEKLLATSVQLKQQALDQKMESYYKTLEAAAFEIKISNNNEFNIPEALSTADNLIKTTNTLSSHFALEDGRTYNTIARGLIKGLDAKKKKRVWYTGIITEGKKWFTSQPYVSTTLKKLVMALGVPIYKNDLIAGALCVNIDLNEITNFITKLSNDQNIFVSNYEGFIFASKNVKEIGKNLFELIPEFKQYRDNKQAEFSFKWNEKNNRKFKVYTAKLQSQDWILWQYESYDNIEKNGNIYFINSLIFLGIFTVIALILNYLLASYIANPLISTTRILSILSETGNTSYTVNKKLLKRKDEIGAMEKALHSLITVLADKAKIAKDIASGNLKNEVPCLSNKDDLGQAFSQMNKDLNSILKQINTAVIQVNNSANEISSASQNLAEGATRQAASLEEITSSMTALGSQTAANAENATAANNLANETARAAVTGQEKMNKLTEAMTQINNNAQETQKVIKTIDDIAFQTNLLALNAAVEAARAGIHGKGFAVVAEEVRNLAARSAKAAAETTELIQNSNNQIEKGVTISEQTADALNVISANVTKTTDTIAEIASSSSEQAEGIKQINIGLEQIDSVTQQNTANAEETASASTEMSTIANLLQKLVKHFKLKEIPTTTKKTKVKQKKYKKTELEPFKKAIPQNTGWADTPDNSQITMIESDKQINLDDNEFAKF